LDLDRLALEELIRVAWASLAKMELIAAPCFGWLLGRAGLAIVGPSRVMYGSVAATCRHFMTRRQLAWIALTVLAALAMVGTLWSAFGPDKIVLTTAQLQERVNRALPREFKGVTVEQATVTVADSRLALRVEASAAALGQTLKAVVSARGVPRYDSERGEIFFDAEDVKVTDFSLAGGNLAARIDRSGGALRDRVEAAAGNLIAAGLKAYLAARPVYRFKDDFKGLVLKAAIADVATQPDAVVITVSLVKLTETVGIDLALLLVFLVLIIALVRHPSWGLELLGAALDGASQS
jgi:hypothetical protein